MSLKNCALWNMLNLLKQQQQKHVIYESKSWGATEPTPVSFPEHLLFWGVAACCLEYVSPGLKSYITLNFCHNTHSQIVKKSNIEPYWLIQKIRSGLHFALDKAQFRAVEIRIVPDMQSKCRDWSTGASKVTPAPRFSLRAATHEQRGAGCHGVWCHEASATSGPPLHSKHSD